MVRPGLPWLTVLVASLVVAVAPPRPVHAAGAEVKLDKEYLAGLVEKLPPLPFQTPGKARGTAHDYRLVAIDPTGRRFVVACIVDGEYRPPISGALARRDDEDDGTWRRFRFEVHLSINVEPGRDGTPRFKIVVDEVRRKELEGLAGTLAKLLGKYFDDIATRIAAGKANQLSGKLNAEIVKRIAAFKEYGVFTGIDYTPALVVLRFEMTRFKSEGIAGYVYPPGAAEGPPPGTVPLYRAMHRKLGTHLYTVSREEAARRGFQIEGIACHVFDRPFQQTVPLYRWGIPRDGLYTTARDGEGSARYGYRLEGIACFVFPAETQGTVPFYRFKDPRTGHHFYTVHPHAEFAGPASEGPGRSIAGCVLDHDVDAHRDGMLTAAEDHALDRTDVVIVAAPGQGDMLVLSDQVVGGVDVDPARSGTEDRQPGVRHVDAHQSILTRGRRRQQVPADVSSRQPE
jgi:hypothetical protein